MTAPVLLMVDASYQIYRHCAAHPELQSTDGTYTGGVYGFLESFAKAVWQTGATQAVVCRDTKPYLRSAEYPEYKMLRRSSMDEDLKERYRMTEPLVADLMRIGGVPTWGIPGLECDDLIGHVVRRRRSRYSRIFAMANDSDLYQLLDAPGFAVYKDNAGTAMTAARLLRETGLTPAEFTLATALSGTHNEIAGIPSVGEKRSRAAVRDAALMRKYRDGYASLIERNAGLIRLPHAATPRCTPVPSSGDFDPRALYRWCDRLDINCTSGMERAFIQLSERK